MSIANATRKTWSAWGLIVFLAALGLLAVVHIWVQWGEWSRTSQALRWASTSMLVSQAAHELQRERGFSYAVLTNGGSLDRTSLHQQRERTDQAINESRRAMGTIDLPTLTLDHLYSDLQQLASLRSKVDAQTMTGEDVMAQYSTHIRNLLKLNPNPHGADNIRNMQLAIASLIQAKELAGQVRARVAAVLSNPALSERHVDPLIEKLQAEERLQWAIFEVLIPLHWKEAVEKIHADNTHRQVVLIVDRIQDRNRSPVTGMPLPTSREWFDIASKRIDLMKNLADQISEEYSNILERDKNRLLMLLIVNILVAVLTMVIAMSIVISLWRARQKIGNQLAAAQSIIDSSLEAIVLTDAQGHFIWVNAAFSRMTGYDTSDVLGQHVRLLKSGRHDISFYKEVWGSIAEHGAWTGEVWNRRRSGDIFPALLSIVRLPAEDSRAHQYAAMSLDLTLHKKTEETLERIRSLDPLTGLLSRSSWILAVQNAISLAGQNELAVVELGLDRFKHINESLSHGVGDAVLVEIAERLKRILRRHDVCARSAGDRFLIMFQEFSSAKDISNICQKLLRIVGEPIHVDGLELRITASAGVAIYPQDGLLFDQLHGHAESAMFRAKSQNRGGVCFYAQEIDSRIDQSIQLEQALRKALSNHEFYLLYQPQVDAGTRELKGVEALIRWKSAEFGNVAPSHFIPLAEETNLILEIGYWVLQQAVRDCCNWLKVHNYHIPIAVNLSPRQFAAAELEEKIREILDESELPGHLLELEITESSLVGDPTEATRILERLKDSLQVRIALDDFGTGYSSMSYLKHFPIDRLKIDRAFVRDVPVGNSDVAICRTIISLGKNLGLEVLAEGVETEEQGEFLSTNGCDLLQGYLYGRPITAVELMKRLGEGKIKCASTSHV